MRKAIPGAGAVPVLFPRPACRRGLPNRAKDGGTA